MKQYFRLLALVLIFCTGCGAQQASTTNLTDTASPSAIVSGAAVTPEAVTATGPAALPQNTVNPTVSTSKTHYARIDKLPNGRYALKKSVTAAKDQTYALYNLTQDQLSHTLMPVGEYEKENVRKMAEEAGLPVAHKPDSQEICFVSDNDYASFIEKETGVDIPTGNFVDVHGNVLGTHKGITHYTIGQRKGLGLAMGHPVFVCEIRPETNEVVIGENEDIFTTTIRANHLNFMSVEDIDGEARALAKIRYNHRGDMCTLRKIDEDTIEAVFDKPQRAATPGQALVFYDGDYVMGGGTIL